MSETLSDDEKRPDFYSDTDHRMANDPAFNAVVNFLMRAAREHGFTPGELKQMAFRAAYELELRSTSPVRWYGTGPVRR
jgi:hypothetical protein